MIFLLGGCLLYLVSIYDKLYQQLLKMPTGVIDLVAYGTFDTHLTANPQITFFRTVYRRHTNFAIESIEQTFTQYPQFGKKTSLTLTKNGDLVNNMYALVTLPANISTTYYIYGVGNALFKKIDVTIGGFVIDTHYSDWLNIWGELTTEEGKLIGYDKMVSNYYQQTQANSSTCYVPFRFWFNRNPGLALPLVALAYQDVQFLFEFETMENLSNNTLTSSANTLNCRIYADYIFLDTEERRLFGQNMHEYLIDQVQYNEFQVASGSSFYNAKLNFNLPVKELIWVHTPTTTTDYGNFDYSCNGTSTPDMHTFTSGKLVVNGSDRMPERFADYYYLVQNYQRHTRVPRTSIVHNTYDDSLTLKTNAPYRNYIYTYSFALEPENHQPSGNCNFSKLKNAELQLKYNAIAYFDYTYSRKLKVFAVNYNVLKIGSGMAGLAYSN